MKALTWEQSTDADAERDWQGHVHMKAWCKAAGLTGQSCDRACK
jgi:hypothetical protein